MITGFFEYKGKIKAKQRPRFSRGRVFTPSATHKSEESLGWSFKAKNPHIQPTNYPINLMIDIYLPIPRSWSNVKRSMAMTGEIRPIGKPDLDNTLKTIKDALNGLLYTDDSQVVSVRIHKRYSAGGFDYDYALIAWEILTNCEARKISNKQLR